MKYLIYKILSSDLLSRCIGPLFNVQIPSFGGIIHVIESTSNKNKTAIFLGFYELPERSLIKKYLKKNLSVIECGASLGIVTRTIQKTISNNQKIIALEPNHRLLNALKKNTSKNHLAKVYIEQAALGDGTESEFFINDDNLASSHLGDGVVTRVQTMTLSDVAERHGIKEYSLVLDIEGFEHSLINSEADSLEKADTIIIEIHGGETLVRNFISKISLLGFDYIDKKHSTHVFRKKAPIVMNDL